MFRYGIRAFDTSAYYGPSEIVLGGVLKALKDEFPRESYKLVTDGSVSWILQGTDNFVLDNQVWSIWFHSGGFRLLPEYDSEERTEESRTFGYGLSGCRVST